MEMKQRLGLTIKRAEQVLIRAKTKALEPIGLTVPQYAALLCIGEEPGLSAAEIARRCLVTPQTMTTILGNLSDKGLTERRNHPTIGHVLQTFLSPKGKRVLTKADRVAIEVEQRLASDLSGTDRQLLHDLLETCILSLNDTTKDR